MLDNQKYMKEIAEEIHCCGSSLNLKGVYDVDRKELTYLMMCGECNGTLVLKHENQIEKKQTSNF
jgi:predicted metal-binding protein